MNPQPLQPEPDHKFTFGFWTVGDRGRDPFGDFVRPPISPIEIVHILREVGAWGVNLHDNDLVPIDATPAECDAIVRDFKQACKQAGLVVPTATVLFSSIQFFATAHSTSNDPEGRAYAPQRTMRAMDLGAELGAKIFVLWGGREGVETDASRHADEAVIGARLVRFGFQCELETIFVLYAQRKLTASRRRLKAP